jgi:hypothetical protein
MNVGQIQVLERQMVFEKLWKCVAAAMWRRYLECLEFADKQL